MSIASKLITLNTITNNIKNKLRNWGIMPIPSGVDTAGLSDCYDTLNAIGGTRNITGTSRVDVLGNAKRYAQVNDANLVPENIASGVTILGITGTHGGSPSHPDYTSATIEYGSADDIEGTYYPSDYGHDYFSNVTLRILPDSDSTKTLKPENIKNGVTVLGVQGNYSIPTETESPTVTVVDSRTMTIPVEFSNIQEAIFINIEMTQGGATNNSKVISIVFQKISNATWYSVLHYINGSNQYCYGLFSYNISNGVLTITLNSNSVFTFVTEVGGYKCSYTYIS